MSTENREFLAPPGAVRENEAAHYDALLARSKTLAEFLKEVERSQVEQILARLPDEQKREILEESLRRYDPWPDWVLRIYAEVLHVDLPTIPKRTIEDALRLAHWVFFELRLDGASMSEAAPKLSLSPGDWGSLVGHLLAHMEDRPRRMERLGWRGDLPPDLQAKVEELSSSNVQKRLTPHLARILFKHPTELLSFTQALEAARSRTFDKTGESRTTPLTPVYKVILESWERLERMSGPTELAKFLRPHLYEGKGFEDSQLGRVKSICNRFGIRFRRRVKVHRRLPPA